MVSHFDAPDGRNINLDCGATVPAQVFVQSAKTLIERQEPDGPKVPRVIVSTDPHQSDYVVGHDRARGWSYLQEPFLATGSMTTSGIAVLAIAHDALTNPDRSNLYDAKLERALTTAVADGFAWLDVNFTVERNPGKNAPAWHYYYLYGLERAAIYGGKVLIGEHDWYVLGARYLVSHQKSDGRWSTGALGGAEYEPSDVVDTAWAILFLKKATKPMECCGPSSSSSTPIRVSRSTSESEWW